VIFTCPHCGGPNECPRPGVFCCCDCGKQFEVPATPPPATPPAARRVRAVTRRQSSRAPSSFGIAFGGCFGVLVAICVFSAVGTLLLVFLSVGCLSCVGTARQAAREAYERQKQETEQAVRTLPADVSPVTFLQFSRVQDGMLYKQVATIMGREGVPVSSAVPPFVEDVIARGWYNPDRSHIIVLFDSGRVSNKWEAGIYERASRLSP